MSRVPNIIDVVTLDAASPSPPCIVCSEPILWGRRDRLTCSSACRQRRSRVQRGVRHGWGGPTDRRVRRQRARAKEAVIGHRRPRGAP